jgi:hypothetical protein
MHLGSFHDKWFTIEKEGLFPDLEVISLHKQGD